MKNKRSPDNIALVILLAAACLALAIPVAILNPLCLIAPAVVVVIVAVLLIINIRRLRRFVVRNLCGRQFEGSKLQYSLAELPVPVMLLDGKKIVWYNDIFREQVLADVDAVQPAVERFLPGFDLSVCARPHGQDLAANGASPNAFTSTDITGYYFESTEKFEENLKILLSFVSVPYFTPESVAKEQGIIGQEIRMIEPPGLSQYRDRQLRRAVHRYEGLRAGP